jgi:hypothetical protein
MIEGHEHDEKVNGLPCLLQLFVYLLVFIPVCLICVFERLTCGVWVFFAMNSWLVNLHLKLKVTQTPTGAFQG